MRKKVLLLVNPSAGTGSARQNTYRMVEALALRGCETTVYPLLPAHGLTAEKLLAECGGRFDLVACCGGDGTLNHVICGLMALDRRPRLGYLPGGSTNDFANSLGLALDLEQGCAALADGRPFPYDIGRFNQTYFNYVAAFGAFTAVSYSTPQDTKNALGHAAYVLKGILSLPESMSCRCHMKVEHDGQTEEEEYLYGSVTNATSVGGFTAPNARQVRLDDGLFEVMLIKAPATLREGEQILAALTRGEENPYVRLFQTDRIRFTAFQRTAWTLDGEYGGTPDTAEISVAPQAVSIMLPRQEAGSDEGL